MSTKAHPAFGRYDLAVMRVSPFLSFPSVALPWSLPLSLGATATSIAILMGNP